MNIIALPEFDPPVGWNLCHRCHERPVSRLADGLLICGGCCAELHPTQEPIADDTFLPLIPVCAECGRQFHNLTRVAEFHPDAPFPLWRCDDCRHEMRGESAAQPAPTAPTPAVEPLQGGSTRPTDLAYLRTCPYCADLVSAAAKAAPTGSNGRRTWGDVGEVLNRQHEGTIRRRNRAHQGEYPTHVIPRTADELLLWADRAQNP